MVYRTTPAVVERKNARRRKLLDAATRMFGAHGYHATTVPMIVEESGSSTGSFYFYFRNKEDVFAAVLESVAERLSEALNVAIAGARTPLGQMEAAVKGLFTWLAENPALARILILESSGLGGRLAEVRRAILASHARSVEMALSGLRSQLPALDPAVAAHCWVGSVFEAVTYWQSLLESTRPPADVVAAEVARFNLRAIGAR